MNKCTLLIDGNWLLISRFSVMINLFNSSLSEDELTINTNKLKDAMAKSICVILNKLPMIDNIIFISDGGSWRKQLPIPKQLDGVTYKGNRGKISNTSWSHVFQALRDLFKSCEVQGITTCTQTNIEGDDWVWYWSRRLNSQGINCIIWSSDHDLMQLIQNKCDVFTAWFYDRSGESTLALHDSFEIKNPDPDDLDFFMNPIVYRPRILENLSKLAYKTEYINPNSIINSKVICGDSGDNIKSVARVVKKGRTYGVGPKDWEKVANKLNINSIQDLIQHSADIANEISLLKKFNNNVDANQIREMIEYNTKLVWLDEAVIPETIVAVMNQQEYKVVDTNYFRGSYTALLGEDNNIKNIFES